MRKILFAIFVMFGVGSIKAQTITDPSDSTEHYHIYQWIQGVNPGSTNLNRNADVIDDAIWNVESQLTDKVDADGATLTGVASFNATYSAFLAVSASVVDWSLRNNRTKTLSANTTLTFTNTQDGQVLNLIVSNPDNYTLAFSGVDGWADDTEPTPPGSGDLFGIYTFIKIGNAVYGALKLF